MQQIACFLVLSVLFFSMCTSELKETVQEKGEKKDSMVLVSKMNKVSKVFIDTTDYDLYESKNVQIKREKEEKKLEGISKGDICEKHKREGDSPEEFARAIAWPAIKMVYPEQMSVANVKVLGTEGEQRYKIKLQLKWSDRWTSGYMMDGELNVDKDGKNAQFIVTNKNLKAESLEFTHEKTRDSLELEQI